MKKILLVGLGNIGEKYTKTRHNAGFWLIEHLVRLHSASLKIESKLHSFIASYRTPTIHMMLSMPTTFMNNSGIAVRAISDYYKIELDDIIIAYDELDLPTGKIRLKVGGGSGGHNGIKSITSHLNTPDYKRIRIGVDRPAHSYMFSDYVLSPISKDTEAQITTGIELIIKHLDEILLDFPKAQNHLNSI